MNRFKIILAVAFLFSGLQVFAQDETDILEVTGLPHEVSQQGGEGIEMAAIEIAPGMEKQVVPNGDLIEDGRNEASLANVSETSLVHAPLAMMSMSDMDYEKELLHIRNSLMKYRREKLTGIWLTIGGGFVYGLSVGLYEADVLDEDGAAVVLITGGLLAISGSILQLTSNRWLKQAYLGPTRSGIGLGLNF